MSLAAQNFTASIIHDSLELQKQKRTAPQQRLKDQGYNVKDKRLVLSMGEVAEALQEVRNAMVNALKVLAECCQMVRKVSVPAVWNQCKTADLL